MGLIEDELEEVNKLAQNVVAGCRLVSCVPSMVRAEISRSKFKTIIACIQFSADYPRTTLLLELKSKTLSEKLLQGLTDVCEREVKKALGKPQVLIVLKFVANFIEENPLCCCYDEISLLKKGLTGKGDEIKLKQKTSIIHLNVYNEKYFFNVKIGVPGSYPDDPIGYVYVPFV